MWPAMGREGVANGQRESTPVRSGGAKEERDRGAAMIWVVRARTSRVMNILYPLYAA